MVVVLWACLMVSHHYIQYPKKAETEGCFICAVQGAADTFQFPTLVSP